MQLLFIVLALINARPVAFAFKPVDTHVHVIAVDDKNPTGKPLADAQVFFQNGTTQVLLGSTDADGVATGALDTERFGPDFEKNSTKELQLLVRDASNKQLLIKDIKITSKDELARGFAVSVYRPKETVAKTSVSSCESCGGTAYTVCCPCQTCCECECYTTEFCECQTSPAGQCFVPCNTGYWVVPGCAPRWTNCGGWCH